MRFIKKRISEFVKNDIEWQTSILNVILCVCMCYFYIDSNFYAPLIYSIFFFSYIICVFLFGEKIIPFMYLLYILGAIQNITFINQTGFFIILLLSCNFKNQKKFLYLFYVIEVFLVCFRHDKSVIHLACHFAFCIVFYIMFHYTKIKIEKEAVKNAIPQIEIRLRAEIKEELKDEIRMEILSNIPKLELTENEKKLISELAQGKLLKEIDGFSKNTKTELLEKAMQRNGIATKNELLALYSLKEKLPTLFPTLSHL